MLGLPQESVLGGKADSLLPGKSEHPATASHSQPQQERLLFGQVPVGICGKQAFCQAVGGVPHEKVGRSHIAMAKKGGREQETVAVPHVFTVHN